ncbi:MULTISPECIES: HAD family hydrolase [unclassified Halorhodospira]|uniref:HAD family hydrolase n=1 Tax=unclassified Halorhodospira TaxID=2626748 RepID=UPI001EE979C9|nr:MULTISPECIES: HAD family hydrolase [unclassified Halorhodospira]MCG5540306.1 HAD family hydrolase [Halorhodospira sp. M39old]MCG5545844.1 HAD family hydrolase [Halorhodospira sp. M38]
MIRAPLRALTFDLDDTLWSVEDVLAAAEQTLHDYLREAYPVVAERFDPDRMRQLRRELAAARPELTRNATTLRRATMAEIARCCGIDGTAAERFVEQTFAVFLEARQARVAPFPEVLPALRELSARFRIGVITNGNADVYRTALGPCVDFVVRGVDIDIPKPEPAIFALACERAGVPPGEVLHVGDDPHTDAAGALAAGMQAALMCRHGPPEPPDGVPDCLMVPDMEALRRAIERRVGAGPAQDV